MEVRKQIAQSIALHQRLMDEPGLLSGLEAGIRLIVDAYRKGGKVLLCGNGGSAADAQHLAAELTGRFYFEREPLHAEALHVNASFVTATANDDSFEKVYGRMVQALGKPGDVLLALSTSGNSPNILYALECARERGLNTLGFTGQGGGRMQGLCDILLRVPSADTPRIQEMHMLLGHIVCENTESLLFKK